MEPDTPKKHKNMEIQSTYSDHQELNQQSNWAKHVS